MNQGKKFVPVSIAVVVLVCIYLASAASSALAAVQGPVDEKYKIPVPKAQKKIGVGDAKEFEDGVINIKVLSVERSSVELSVNDGESFSLESSKLQLVPIDDATMCTLAYLGKSGAKAIMSARCDPMTEESQAAAESQAANSGKEVVKPMDLIEQTAKGEMVNPYTDDPEAIEEGRSLFFANSCNGCHGGTGGGGMGPPLSNAVWVYGAADDTLFRLVILGSDGLLADGYSRVARETVVGPMPSFGTIIENSDHLWKILAFVRSFYNGDPDKRTW